MQENEVAVYWGDVDGVDVLLDNSLRASINSSGQPNRVSKPEAVRTGIQETVAEWFRRSRPKMPVLVVNQLSERAAKISTLTHKGPLIEPSQDQANAGVHEQILNPTVDPLGATTVALGANSAFYGLVGRRYFGTSLDITETNDHHHGAVQDYSFGRSVTEARSFVIGSTAHPHPMAGMSASMHKLAGITATSNWLPHHSIGTPKTGGDSCADSRLRSRLSCAVLSMRKPRLVKRVYPARLPKGTWWGNDTFWRTILDLNRALLYARADGSLADDRQRETLAVVKVPAAPAPARPSLIVAGRNFCAVDMVCAKLMGFDWKRMPHLSHVFDDHELPLVDFRYQDIIVRSEISALDRRLAAIDREDCARFQAPAGWTGWLEEHGG